MENTSKGNYFAGEWVSAKGDEFLSFSPAKKDCLIWRGFESTEKAVNDSFSAARTAVQDWSLVDLETRIELVKRFQQVANQNAESLALTISQEMGKPLWEARTEAKAVAGKVDLAIDALMSRRSTTTSELSGYRAVTRYKPHGVLGILGPFNLPAHLPNGHIVPALLAGNTVVFKPSEFTPAIAEQMIQFWHEAGLPPGVVNLVQGGRRVGEWIVQNPELDGLLFTGSSKAGVAINQQLAAQPQKIVALEMGGNNPLIIHETDNPKAAAYETLLSSYITSGQRCTCARRLILIRGNEGDAVVEHLLSGIQSLKVGYYDDPVEPFIGPVVSAQTGERILHAQEDLIGKGGKPLVTASMQRDNYALLSPGLMDVSKIDQLEDEEVFGPFLQLHWVDDFEEAIQKANATKYGLSAGLFSDVKANYQRFISTIRAGVVNWNRQTTGASGGLPFGGCGLSGNHRPSGYFAADYCSFPVASLESEQLKMPENMLPGIALF